jgi:hypothetical protein
MNPQELRVALLDAVNGALKNAIDDHGPITEGGSNKGSAAKRIVGTVMTLLGMQCVEEDAWTPVQVPIPRFLALQMQKRAAQAAAGG